MNISVLKEKLLKPLSLVGKNISSKNQLPITQHIYLEAKDGYITLATTNLETTVYTKIPAKIEKEGGICVPIKIFSEYIQSLPEDKVVLKTDKENLTIVCGGYEALIPGIGKDEFPQVIKKRKEEAKIEGGIFLDAVKKVAFAAATDEGRPLLTGVKIKKDKNGCLFVATDGYRLALKKADIPLSEKFDTVLPGRALLEVAHVGEDEKEKQDIVMGTTEDGHTAFFIGETEVYTRSIGGEYPNFEKIIPKSATTIVRLKKDALFRAMKSVAIFARDSANIVRFRFGKNSVLISANTPQVGENKAEIDAESEGDEGDIAFNSRFLLEFLTNAPGEDLVFEMTGSLNPGVFKIPNDDSYLHIIMPVRVQAS